MADPCKGVIQVNEKELCRAAMAAMQKSYSPYSGYCVGAALLTADGDMYTGCNIENASYTPTICAERTAFFKAVSAGVRQFSAIAVAGGKDGVITGSFPPCGVCRQVMAEFCDPDFVILVVTGEENYDRYTLAELLPCGFGPRNLQV